MGEESISELGLEVLGSVPADEHVTHYGTCIWPVGLDGIRTGPLFLAPGKGQTLFGPVFPMGIWFLYFTFLVQLDFLLQIQELFLGVWHTTFVVVSEP